MTTVTDPDIVPAMRPAGVSLWTPHGPRIVTGVGTHSSPGTGTVGTHTPASAPAGSTTTATVGTHSSDLVGTHTDTTGETRHMHVSDTQRAQVAELGTKSEQIRHICEQLGHPTTSEVHAWLEACGITANRKYVSRIVNGWRAERGLTDTEELAALTDEVLTELDAQQHPAPVDVDEVTDTDRPTDPTPAPVAAAPRPPAESAATPDRPADDDDAKQSPIITYGLYAVALVSLLVSLNTSWRFFDRTLHISNAYNERAMMFAVAELALVMCGAGMAVNVRRHGSPGGFRLVVWALCGASAVMALLMSDTPGEALGRVIVGPFLGTVMLHLALGLEFRAHHDRQATTAAARIGRELRERLMSRLGLADDDRDAAQRTRDRAAQRAAKLATADVVIARRARVRRAMRAANVAHDPQMMARMLAERDIEQHVDDFRTLERPSPFAAYTRP